MYNGMCCVAHDKVLKRNLGSQVPRWANISEWAVKREQCPPTPSMFHNVMVFMILHNGYEGLHNRHEGLHDGYVDFEQWLG
jgi:hypothetical protein